MKRYQDLIRDCLSQVREIYPWDLRAILDSGADPLLLDVREPYEFAAMHMAGAINVPRGILESACEYGYEETVPELVEARDREIVVICRSGYRSVLAAFNMQLLGYRRTRSLKTGLRGWNEYEQPLVDAQGHPVSIEDADRYFISQIRPEQQGPRGGSQVTDNGRRL